MWAALLGVACGPPALGLSGSGDDSSDSATPAETGEGESSESETTDSSEPDPDTTDTTDTTDTDTTDTDFVPRWDAVPGHPCEPFLQDCPEGEKCVPWGSTGGNWDSNKCVPILGEGAPGDPCTYAGTAESTDDCGPDSFCWNVQEVEDELVGTCAQFCTGTYDDPECPEPHACLIDSNGVFNLCIRQCDPIAQDCDLGQGCYWANNDFNCVPTRQNIPAGEPCGFINECAPGLGCFTAEVFPECAGSACCSPFCDLDLGGLQCESVPGTSCVPFFEQGMAPPGYEHIGVCVLP